MCLKFIVCCKDYFCCKKVVVSRETYSYINITTKRVDSFINISAK